MTYNGYTNKETHMVDYWASESLADYVEYAQSEGYYIEVTPSYYKKFVLDMLETSGASVEEAFADELICHTLSNVNWEELAKVFNGW